MLWIDTDGSKKLRERSESKKLFNLLYKTNFNAEL